MRDRKKSRGIVLDQDIKLSIFWQLYPGSFGLKFIPNQSEIFLIILEFVSAPNSFISI